MATADAAADLGRRMDLPPGSTPEPAPPPAPAPGSGPEPSAALPPPIETPTDAPAPPVEALKPEVAVQANMVRGGAEAPITLQPKERVEISRILTIRLNEAQARRDKAQSLDPIDEVILKPEVMSRIKSGEFSAEDLATAWYVIDVELHQKILAVAAIMADDPTRFNQIRNTPLVERLVRDPASLTTEELSALKALYDNQEYREFIRDIGYGRVDGVWDGARAYKDLKNLDDIRTTLEGSFYRDAPKDSGRLVRFRPRRQNKPADDEILLRSPVSDVLDQSGHKAYRELARQVREVIKQRVEADPNKFGGLIYRDIREKYPIEALRIRQEAAGNALLQKARISAQEIVEGKRYSGDSALIEQKADELRTPPKDEELAPLKAAKTVADAELVRAQQELERVRTTLPQEISQAGEAVRTAETAKNKAKGLFDAIDASIKSDTGEVASLRSQISTLANKIEITSIPKGGIDPTAGITQTIDNNNARIRAYFDRLATAEQAMISAEEELKSAQTRLDQLRGTDIVVGKLQAAENTVTQAKERAGAAQRDLDGKTSPERTEMADALDDWVVTVDGRSRLDDVLTSPKFGDEYPIEKLTDTTIRLDGQVEGAERLRDLMSRTIDKNLDPDRTRLRISDEALAIRIIESVPGLYDAKITIPPGPGIIGGESTFRAEIDSLKDAHRRLEEAKRTKTDTSDIDAEIKARERTLILQAIPRLRSANPTRAQIYSFINGTIDEGLRSAELGNPYLSMIR